ncbi:MAG: hypothetical protein JO073_05760 [Actinobacteria bacterium]|nr:hypothetical protein [Actinomycetota bacterium]
MARQRTNPEMKVSRSPVTGVHKPRAGAEVDHHQGFNLAIEDALKNIGRARGRYHAHVHLSALVDVKNPGHIVEYHATLT